MDAKAEELAAIIQEIRLRARARHPNPADGSTTPLANLTALLHARDAAEGKVAAIGSVNPRPPGLVNSIVQTIKRQVARALDWHVREQVEFNRAIVSCVQAAIEALNESNLALAAWSARLDELSSPAGGLLQEARELKDVRAHWLHWREEWERKLASNEIHFLRGLADLQASFQHRVTLLDSGVRDRIEGQHAQFERSLYDYGTEIQKRLWADLERMRADYDGLIHSELRLLRQRAAFAQAAPPPPQPVPQASGIDWLKFAEKFRGSEEAIAQRLGMYAERFAGCSNVLDIGCGRGELLETFRDAHVSASGIDLSAESVALCRSKGLEAEQADLFAYLSELPDSSLGGVTCVQVAEHLPPERLPEFIRLTHAKLRRDGLIAIETPNPECLAIFATHFYLDPTHTRPVPPMLLAFYLEEAGFGAIDVVRLSPAADSMPSLAALPEEFCRDFFGALDYAIFARKL
jgi:2-polyprenyl-3-methyl-5-hydroxy-6-metoxy-1,4-benzoquinol methylase